VGPPPPAAPLTRRLAGRLRGDEKVSPLKGPRTMATTRQRTHFQIPGMTAKASDETAAILQERLGALIDLGLTLKHIHWNVVGRSFIGVHLMLDPQVAAVQEMVDETAERIATLGASPNGLAGNLVETRSWDDYAIGRASTQAHLGGLDQAYSGVVEAHREAIAKTEDLDPVTQDMLIGHAAQLEQFHWFVRAHLETSDGNLVTEGADGETDAATRADNAS
jgi:starvation-inducible DNA-binding protein